MTSRDEALRALEKAVGSAYEFGHNCKVVPLSAALAILSARQEVAPVAELTSAVRMLLDSAPAHMTPRNAKEREAYKLIRSIMKETT